MTALSDLIARLEAAKVGSRELDAAIFKTACDAELRPYSKGPRVRNKWWFKKGSDTVLAYGEDKHPNFTTSLDAALDLRPRTWGEILERAIERCELFSDLPRYVCIEALKAREAGR